MGLLRLYGRMGKESIRDFALHNRNYEAFLGFVYLMHYQVTYWILWRYSPHAVFHRIHPKSHSAF